MLTLVILAFGMLTLAVDAAPGACARARRGATPATARPSRAPTWSRPAACRGACSAPRRRRAPGWCRHPDWAGAADRAGGRQSARRPRRRDRAFLHHRVAGHEHRLGAGLPARRRGARDLGRGGQSSPKTHVLGTRRYNQGEPQLLKRGFTLIELMVALGLLSVVLLFVFNTFTYQHATYTVVDQVSEAQQNSRPIARLIERDMRNAGYLVPPRAGRVRRRQHERGPTCCSSATPTRSCPPISCRVEFAGKELGGRRSTDTSRLTPAGHRRPRDLDVDTVVLDGDRLLRHRRQRHERQRLPRRRGRHPRRPRESDPRRGLRDRDGRRHRRSDLQRDRELPRPSTTPRRPQTKQLSARAGARLPDRRRVRPPQLERDGVLLAKDVEDLQVAWFYDDNEDEVVDADEERGDSATDYDTTNVDGRELREIRVNLVIAHAHQRSAQSGRRRHRTVAREPRHRGPGRGRQAPPGPHGDRAAAEPDAMRRVQRILDRAVDPRAESAARESGAALLVSHAAARRRWR